MSSGSHTIIWLSLTARLVTVLLLHVAWTVLTLIVCVRTAHVKFVGLHINTATCMACTRVTEYSTHLMGLMTQKNVNLLPTILISYKGYISFLFFSCRVYFKNLKAHIHRELQCQLYINQFTCKEKLKKLLGRRKMLMSKMLIYFKTNIHKITNG